MTNIPTVNLLIASEEQLLREVLGGLGTKGTTLQGAVNKIDPRERKGLLLFNNEANPNFISFEHQFNLPETKAVLKFIDPKGEFESNFLATGSIFRSLVATAEKVKERKNRKDQTASKSVDLPPLTEEELARLTEGNLEKFLYVAYGVGSNPEDWSGIHRMKINRINYTVDGAREFTLVLVDVTRGLSRIGRTSLLKKSVNLNTFGHSLVGSGRSEKIRYEDLDTGYPVYGYEEGKYQPIDYHLLIVDTLVDYVRKVCSGANVVCLLPDLNFLLEDYVKGVDAAHAGAGSSGDRKLATLKALEEVLRGLKLDHICIMETKNSKLFGLGAQPIPNGLRSFYDAVQIGNKRTDSNNYVINGTWKAQLKSPEGDSALPDFIEPIRQLVNAINEYASVRPANFPISMSYFTESDMDVLKVWGNEDNKDKYTFNGLKTFDIEKPTVVIGHPSMLSILLFPKKVKSEFPKNLIHPVNAKDLGDKYKKQMQNIDRSQAGRAFGSPSQVPDVFGFRENISKEALDIIKSENIPVFRHNTSNPNVLSIKLNDESAAYFSLLRAGYEKQVYRTAVNLGAAGKAGVRVADFPITDMKTLNAAIQTSLFSNFGPELSDEQIINDIAKRVTDDLKLDMAVATRKEVAKIIKTTIDRLRSDQDLKIRIGQRVNANPGELMTHLANDLRKKTTQVTVETLPMFFVSSKTKHISSPVVVFSQDAPMVNQVFPNRTRFNNYLTGIYSILAYSHTISSGKAQSSFVLARSNFSLDEPIPARQASGRATADEMAYREYETGGNENEIYVPQVEPTSEEEGEVITPELEAPKEEKVEAEPEPQVIEVPINKEMLDIPESEPASAPAPTYDPSVEQENQEAARDFFKKVKKEFSEKGFPKETKPPGWYTNPETGETEYYNGGVEE